VLADELAHVRPERHLVHLAELGEERANLRRRRRPRDVVNLHRVILQRDVAHVHVFDGLALVALHSFHEPHEQSAMNTQRS
jgi:hypothetical protein